MSSLSNTGFSDEISRSGMDRVAVISLVIKAGKHDDRHMLHHRILLYVAAEINAVHSGHAYVCDHQVGHVGQRFEYTQRLHTIGGHFDPEVVLFEQRRYGQPFDCAVFHHEDHLWGLRAGISLQIGRHLEASCTVARLHKVNWSALHCACAIRPRSLETDLV